MSAVPGLSLLRSPTKKHLVVSLVAILGLALVPAAIVLGANGPSVDVYSQCGNGDGSGPTCNWTNGNLNAANSTYHEGDATPQRLAIDGIAPDSTHTITLSYDTTKGGKHAYDYLTTDNFSETWVDANQECASPISNLANCSGLTPNTFAIPHDSHLPATIHEAGSPVFKIFNGTITNVGAPQLTGSYSGDSETTVSVTFDVPADCVNQHNISGNNSCEVLITFGAHISSEVDWGIGQAAVNIPGSPYHVALVTLDGSAIGQRDNQMQASAIVVTPTVTTELHNPDHSVVALGGSVPLGSTIHDMVTVTGSAPTGSVVLNFYTNGACTGTPFATSSSQSLSSGSADVTSFAQGPLAAGDYSFLAHYNGDTHNFAANATCENFTVAKASPSLTTELHKADHTVVNVGDSVALGTTMHDKATLGGLVTDFTPTNSVTFTFFSNVDCSGTGSPAGVVALVNSVAHPSDSQGPLAAGNYAFQASIAADNNYSSATSDCEHFTVNPAQLSVTTTIHDALHNPITTSQPLGSVVHDSAAVSGSVDGFTLPDVSFTFFGNGTCDGTGTSAGSASVVSGVADGSTATDPLGAGQYSYQATVPNNDNYVGATGACEPLTINQAQLTINTITHDALHTAITNAHVGLGSIVHDTASVSGGVAGFDLPAVSFTLTSSFDTSCASGVSVANNGMEGSAYKSADSAALGAGSYAYRAVVGDNDNYIGNVSACEPFTVDKAQLAVTTNVHDPTHNDITTRSVSLGTITHDTATVTGGVAGFSLPAVSFALTSGYTNDCSAGTSVAVNGTDNGAIRSADSTAHGAGSYAYSAAVASNDNYIGASSACEPFTVNKAQLGLATEIHNSAYDSVVSGPLALGSTVHDKATASGLVSGFTPTHSVSFVFFPNGTCADTSTGAGSVELSGNVAHPSNDEGPLGAGSYSFQASIAGDSNYLAATSDCEPLSINKATPTVTTDIHDVNHNVITTAAAGSTVHDKATVTGLAGFDVTGTVSFTFFTNGTCAQTGSDAGTIGLVGAVADPSTTQGPLSVNSYSFMAHYNGNANYNGTGASCEPLTITKVTPTIATTPNPASGIIGVALTDSAQLGNGFNPTGSITFKLYSPSDTTCANTPAFTNIVTVNGNGQYSTSSGFTSNAVGTWRWVASYSGDSNNNPVVGGCNDEQVTVKAPPVTRTLGFWQTHFNFTTGVFNANPGSSLWQLCAKRKVGDTKALFGGFYASISKTTTGAKRSSLDQARMQLLQQLLAAVLNNLAFGSGSTSTLTSAESAYCGTNVNTILTTASNLDTFNNSGDSQPTTQNTGSANPAASQMNANLTTWDTLP